MLRRPGGREVYRWSATRGFTLALWERALRAGGTWSFELTDRLRVAAGRYVLVARLAGRASLPARLVARRWVTVTGQGSCASASEGRSPPRASAVTRRGEVQLAIGSYCWSSPSVGICADIGFFPGFLEQQPQLVVRPGEVVTFRLRIDPTVVVIGYGPVAGAPVSTEALVPGRDPTWTAPTGLVMPVEGFLLSLFVRGSAGPTSRGDVTYHATLHAVP